jgi:hypothetical protein
VATLYRITIIILFRRGFFERIRYDRFLASYSASSNGNHWENFLPRRGPEVPSGHLVVTYVILCSSQLNTFDQRRIRRRPQAKHVEGRNQWALAVPFRLRTASLK